MHLWKHILRIPLETKQNKQLKKNKREMKVRVNRNWHWTWELTIAFIVFNLNIRTQKY